MLNKTVICEMFIFSDFIIFNCFVFKHNCKISDAWAITIHFSFLKNGHLTCFLKILDSNTEYIFNKKLKLRMERKSCSLQNLRFLRAVFRQPDTCEEKQDYTCICLDINCADQVSRTRGSVTKTKDWMRKFVFLQHPCYLGAFVSAEGTHTDSIHATAACVRGKNPPSWYLSIYTILESCIHW